MRAPAIIAALMATAATHNASGVPAGGASALLATSITAQPAGVAVHWRSTAGTSPVAHCSLVCVAELLLPIAMPPSGGYLCAHNGVYGVADPDRASAPCALSDGRDVAWGGSYLCACVDCAGGGAGCVRDSWSAACDGDAPCRAPDGTIGTMRDGRVCITRQGAASRFTQLCVAGSAAPLSGT